MTLEASRKRWLLFDSACSVCRQLAQEIERETGGVVTARSLRTPQVQAMLDQARPGWRWEPTLLEVGEDHLRAFTGLGMAFRLVRILGLRRAWQVERLAYRALAPTARMHKERRQFLRYSGGMLFSLLASSILAACGASTTSAPSPTATSTTKVSGEFVAKDLTTHTYVGLSTDGQHVIAYVCDGDKEHPITFSHWFTGTVNRNMMDLTNAEGAHLVAPLMSQVATGGVTLPDGKSFRFTANAQTDSRAGLYRSAPILGGVSFLAGWIVTEKAVQALSAPTPAGLVGGGILNKQTEQLHTAPQLTLAELTSGQVIVPNVGTFALTHCTDGKCS
jgi:hypothetical protein